MRKLLCGMTIKATMIAFMTVRIAEIGSDNAVNMTFIRKSPDYMELLDSHGDRIQLTRY
jgi:hypothetical protein